MSIGSCILPPDSTATVATRELFAAIRNADLPAVKVAITNGGRITTSHLLAASGLSADSDHNRPILRELLATGDAAAATAYQFTFDGTGTCPDETDNHRIIMAEKVKLLFERSIGEITMNRNNGAYFADGYDTMRLMGNHSLADDSITFLDREYKTNDRGIADLPIGGVVGGGNFERAIRNLGGALGAFQIDTQQGRTAQAAKWKNLLGRTGQRMCALRRGSWGGHSPATQNLIVEFGMYAYLFHDEECWKAALAAVPRAGERSGRFRIAGAGQSVPSIGGEQDSHYEYLLKGGILFGDRTLLDQWAIQEANLNDHSARTTTVVNTTRALSSQTGRYYGTYGSIGAAQRDWDSLKAFISGTMTLSSGLTTANSGLASTRGVTDSLLYARQSVAASYREYWLETFDGEPYRPEVLESIYYLYLYTAETGYLQWQSHILHGLWGKYKNRSDSNSFFYAETLKYPYLTFEDSSVLTARGFDPERFKFTSSDTVGGRNNIIFNTEAHYNIAPWSNYTEFINGVRDTGKR